MAGEHQTRPWRRRDGGGGVWRPSTISSIRRGMAGTRMTSAARRGPSSTLGTTQSSSRIPSEVRWHRLDGAKEVLQEATVIHIRQAEVGWLIDKRMWTIQDSIEELTRKLGGPSKGRFPMNSEYDGIVTQLHEIEGFFLEQINWIGPRRFLCHITMSSFKTEKDLLNDVKESMFEYKTSIENWQKNSKYTLHKVVIGESDLQHGQTDLRFVGSNTNYSYKKIS